MSDKQSENKLLAMLERRGIVRKADSDDVESETEADASQARADMDLRAMFGTPPGDAPKVTPAPRQPIPGMSSPIIPGDRASQADREQAQPVQQRASEPPRGDPVQPRDAALYAAQPQREPQPRPDEFPAEEQPQFEQTQYEQTQYEQPQYEQPRYEQPQYEQPQRAEQARSVAPPVTPQPLPAPIIPAPEPLPVGYLSYEPQQPQGGDTTGVFLEIEELYAALSLRSKRTDSIYLVEEYMKSLPESLPLESRREIVSRIIAASGFDYDLLQGDGIMRVKLLKEYAERFARFTDDYVAMRQAELDSLEQQMYTINDLIESRRDLHKRQFFAIEAEAQRLKDILTFISS